MSALRDWARVDLAGALAILDEWAGRPVIVSVDLAAGAPGIAGMAGVLRPAGHDGGALTLELADSEAWLRLPDGPCFLGAVHDPEANVLVMEFSGEDPSGAAAVFVDIQLLARQAEQAA